MKRKQSSCRATRSGGLRIVLVVALFLGTSLVASAGCQEASDTSADLLLPPRDEEKLGDRTRAEFLNKEEVQLVEDETIEPYVEELGQKALEAAGDDTTKAIEYNFDVIHAPDQVNAFAMPGGEIFFYTGLLKKAESESEVMAVMAHEVAHVTQRHIAKRLVQRYGLNAISQAALGQDPGLVGQLASGAVQTGTMLAFSRKHETESDEVGIKYAIDAGYDPSGFISFFETLQNESEGPQAPVWLRSHPLPEDRITNAKEEIEDRSFDDARTGKQRHEEIIQAIEDYDPPPPMGDAGMPGDVDGGVDAGNEQ